jgi:ABC-2 type transport system ATP-binding protein
VRVPAELRARAIEVLERAPAVQRAEASERHRDWIVVTLDDTASAETAMNDALRALVDAQVPILAFELEGARLSDAFLSMTESA